MRRPAVRGRGGFTLVEAIVAMGLSGLVFAAVATQLVESGRLSCHVTRTLEHARNARELLDTLSADVRAAQITRLYPSFDDRSTEARDGQPGNYLVLHCIDPHGTITRTVGYYVVAQRGGGGLLYRHDSAAGDGEPGELPSTGSAGRHRLLKRVMRLPDSASLFRSARDRGVTVQGEFGTADSAGRGRTEFIECTLSTRS